MYWYVSTTKIRKGDPTAQEESAKEWRFECISCRAVYWTFTAVIPEEVGKNAGIGRNGPRSILTLTGTSDRNLVETSQGMTGFHLDSGPAGYMHQLESARANPNLKQPLSIDHFKKEIGLLPGGELSSFVLQAQVPTENTETTRRLLLFQAK
eukprot:3804671-Amphidinium_carterae.1